MPTTDTTKNRSSRSLRLLTGVWFTRQIISPAFACRVIGPGGTIDHSPPVSLAGLAAKRDPRPVGTPEPELMLHNAGNRSRSSIPTGCGRADGVAPAFETPGYSQASLRDCSPRID